ncbi:hypothetical protein C2845_PM01G34390 [Panicum miliaceum]|uniref:Protein FAR1-RELATED SEQUENCE n=1 Tax=Panicum miliaceum TaxID=4540 RepID=A0A3L6TEJ6_PANMI|nr:hypothetical protein C2845_PM01G34390 [Panicum miliaceum]
MRAGTNELPRYVNDVRDVRNETNGDEVIIISNDSGSCSKQMADGLTRSESTKSRENNFETRKTEFIFEPTPGMTFDCVAEAVEFYSNSINNLCKRIAKEQKADDARKTLDVFKELKKQDPGFQFSVDYDAKNKIKTLMWCTGRGRSHYSCFGDVVTFDTTYCTNIYKMPLGIFVGVNNHFQSIIYAGVLMTDEKTESFEWVFEEFVKLMGADKPQTILSDQCQAMDIAIANCWPGVAHLWCRWHILKTAQEGIGPLFNFGTPFYNQFRKTINDMLTIDEFEKAWHQLLVDFELTENYFMERTWDKRFRWAKPYIKGTYCARMTSTQWSESANNMLKHHVPRNSSMNKFVQNYNNLLTSRYKVEQEAEHETKQKVFVHDQAWPMEIHALQVYTNAAYKLFQKQVDISTRYNVRITTDPSVFLVVHDKAKRKERYARVEFTVKVEDGAGFFECDCGMYSHIGILCCHNIRVMLQLAVSRIPDRHIMNRWTRVAMEMVPDDINFYPAASASMQQPLTYRHRLLSANATCMSLHEEYKKTKDFDDDAYHAQTDVSCSEAGYGSGTDGKTNGNSYGAAGSSAGLSDSELESKASRGKS